MASRSRAAKRSLCGGTQQPTIESPLCGLILCASALRSSTSGPTKERLHFSGAPPSDRAPQPNTSRENADSVRGGWWGFAEPQGKKKPTLVHKAAILNSLTGLYQEANKRDSKCDTVHFVCASANSGAMYPINSDHRRFVPT